MTGTPVARVRSNSSGSKALNVVAESSFECEIDVDLISRGEQGTNQVASPTAACFGGAAVQWCPLPPVEGFRLAYKYDAPLWDPRDSDHNSDHVGTISSPRAACTLSGIGRILLRQRRATPWACNSESDICNPQSGRNSAIVTSSSSDFPLTVPRELSGVKYMLYTIGTLCIAVCMCIECRLY